MKKILSILLSALFLAGCSVDAKLIEKEKQKPIETKKQVQNEDIELLTLFSSKSNVKNRAWVGTFQLVFNDMKNHIIKQDIEFLNEEPTQELAGLNSEKFNSSMLNKKSYYTSYGKTSFKAKKKIKKDIKKKFNETSDVIDSGDWSSAEGKFYAYAMLKKQFEFLKEFDKLEKMSFNNSQEKFDYFGIKMESDKDLDNNVKVLFYENEKEYAIQLLTKTDDIVYLYRTDNDKDFKTLYEEMNKKSDNYNGSKEFLKKDTLMIPKINVDLLRTYPELCGKIIKNTSPQMYFSMAVETLKFEMDKKGGKIKSEALIMTKMIALPADFNMPPRHFNFDKTFNLFLIDKGKKDPYAAFRIEDLRIFQK